MEKSAPYSSNQMSEKNLLDLPKEILIEIFGYLRVADRVRSERVSHLWRFYIGKFGWDKQSHLNYTIVFKDRLRRRSLRLFTNNSMIALLQCVGEILVHLDLDSFAANQVHLSPNVCQWIGEMRNLKYLKVRWSLDDCVRFLPGNLMHVHFSGVHSEASLTMMTQRATRLNSVVLYLDNHIHYQTNIRLVFLNEFFAQMPNLKRLWFKGDYGFITSPNEAAEDGGTSLTSIGEINLLEEINLRGFKHVDNAAFSALSLGCQQLRRVAFDGSIAALVSEQSLIGLSLLPNLEELIAADNPSFTDDVLISIAQRGKLKVLHVPNSLLTDQSMLCLIANCKVLTTLDIFFCENVTDLTLDAVVAEVKRRQAEHPMVAVPPDTAPLPFRLDCLWSDINNWNVLDASTENQPWLIIEHFDDDVLDAFPFGPF